MGALELKYYKTQREFRRGLENIGASTKQINEIVKHESDHLSKAKELGCEALGYGFILTKKPDEEVYNVYSFAMHSETSPQDSIAIALVPENPSEEDIKDARKHGWRT